MSSSKIWTIWFLTIASLGSLVVAGLQSSLQLPLGWSFVTEAFVLALALAIANIEEWITDQEQTEGESLLVIEVTPEEIDQELNG